MEPPGGILDLDETIDEGFSREVNEETGLLVQIDHLTGVYKNMTDGIIALVFRCRVISGTPHPTAEAGAAAWLTPDEVCERMSPAFAVRLLDAQNIGDHAHGSAVRTHDGTDLLAEVNRTSLIDRHLAVDRELSLRVERMEFGPRRHRGVRAVKTPSDSRPRPCPTRAAGGRPKAAGDAQ